MCVIHVLGDEAHDRVDEAFALRVDCASCVPSSPCGPWRRALGKAPRFLGSSPPEEPPVLRERTDADGR